MDMHNDAQWANGGRGSEDEENLVARLIPVVHRSVGITLRRCRPWFSASRLRQETEDICQDILISLLTGKPALQGWNPERGLCLEGFVDMVARRRTLDQLRVADGELGREKVPPLDELNPPDGAPSPERDLMTKNRLDHLLQELRVTLSVEMWHVFELFWMENKSVVEIAELKKLGLNTVHARISRIRKIARRLGC